MRIPLRGQNDLTRNLLDLPHSLKPRGTVREFYEACFSRGQMELSVSHNPDPGNHMSTTVELVAVDSIAVPLGYAECHPGDPLIHAIRLKFLDALQIVRVFLGFA